MREWGGKKYHRRVEAVKGHPGKPMSMAECAQKFRDCAEFSARPLTEKNINAVIEMVSRLEEVDDVTRIITLLLPR